MCHKFLPYFELFYESFCIISFSCFFFKKKSSRKCAGAYPNAENSHHAICKITVSYPAICKIANFYGETCKIAVFYRAVGKIVSYCVIFKIIVSCCAIWKIAISYSAICKIGHFLQQNLQESALLSCNFYDSSPNCTIATF